MPPRRFIFSFWCDRKFPRLIIDRHVAAVGCRKQLDRLERVRVTADDEIRARVRHCLRPGELVVVRTEGVLRSPVREDDDEIRRLLCLLDAAADRFLTGKHIDHPALFGHGVVRP